MAFRERYSHMVTPVLVHAQRRLLDRISFFGGPPAPQPHFTHTAFISGEKVERYTSFLSIHIRIILINLGASI